MQQAKEVLARSTWLERLDEEAARTFLDSLQS